MGSLIFMTANFIYSVNKAVHEHEITRVCVKLIQSDCCPLDVQLVTFDKGNILTIKIKR